MTYNAEQPNWRDRTHPLNELLKTLAFHGGTPTKAELDAIPGGPMVHQEIKDTAREITRLKKHGNFGAARQAADNTLTRLGPRIAKLDMPEPTEPATPKLTSDELAARMFGNY